jgi:hypothetical protein
MKNKVGKGKEIDEFDLRKLNSLRELCIDEDLLDLPAYDSISRADKIQEAWDALKVIETLNNPENE